MNFKRISYYISLLCFPISFLAFINILYASYFDYFLSVNTYLTTFMVSFVVGLCLFIFGKNSKKNINFIEQLVFIIAAGYYITPELVGGASGKLISNSIAYHMKQTLDWSFASAMGLMLLAGVMVVYWIYNKIVGIDNIKLG